MHYRRLTRAALALGLIVNFARPNIHAAEYNSRRPADTSSPRATLIDFIDSTNELYRRIHASHILDREDSSNIELARQILECMDQSELSAYAGEDFTSEAAICLKEILDRVEIPPLYEIPDTEAIEKAGGVEKLTRWRIPGTRITIARVEEGPRRHEYLFSPGTVGRASEYYETMKQLPYRASGLPTSPGFHQWYFSAPRSHIMSVVLDCFPDWMLRRPLGITNWKLLGVSILLPIALFLMTLAYWLQRRIGEQFRERNAFIYCLTVAFPILAALIPLAFIHACKEQLSLRGQPLYILSFFAHFVALLASLIIVFSVINRVAEMIIASPKINPHGLNAQLIRIMAKLFSLTISITIFLEGGKFLGLPLTTLLASAGVGGLAVALAAQDTLKALFGTIMLMADKPFRVGERIVFEKYDGIVEDIGLRSTRIRLLNGHQAIIPNDELARVDIENVGRRPFIRRVADIHLPLDTPREHIEKAVAAIRQVLDGHDGMAPDHPPRVSFNEFNADSFNIRIFYWFTPPNYWEFLAASEKINIAICRIFDEHGIQFSLPFRTTYTSSTSQPEPLSVQISPPD